MQLRDFDRLFAYPLPYFRPDGFVLDKDRYVECLRAYRYGIKEAVVWEEPWYVDETLARDLSVLLDLGLVTMSEICTHARHGMILLVREPIYVERSLRAIKKTARDLQDDLDEAARGIDKNDKSKIAAVSIPVLKARAETFAARNASRFKCLI